MAKRGAQLEEQPEADILASLPWHVLTVSLPEGPVVGKLSASSQGTWEGLIMCCFWGLYSLSHW